MQGLISIGAFVTARPKRYWGLYPTVQGIYIDDNLDGTIDVLTQSNNVFVCDRDVRVVVDKELFGNTLEWVKAWRKTNLKAWEVE